MAVVSTVKLSELEGPQRIDAEYYQPQYMELVEKIKEQHRYFTLHSIGCGVVSGPFGSSLKSGAYLSEGVPFVRIQDLGNFFINKKELVYISQKDNERLKSSELKVGDLVLSKVGNTIGVVSIVTDDIGNCNISENNIGIRFPTRTKTELKLYILTFLNSKLGHQQVLRRISGNAQPKLNVRDISEMVIHSPSEDLLSDVDDLICRSKVLVDRANSYYAQAENLLLEELGLKDFKPMYELSYTANLSKAFGVHRIDAEYFQPAYEALLKKIEEFEFSKLGQIAERVLTKVKPDPAQIYKYIEISDIAVAIGETNYTERRGKELPPNARIPINGGELIISKVRPTRGAISIIPRELDTSVICSSALSVFRTESPLKEYLYMVSRSVVGRLQMERPTTGTSYPTIADRDIENIEIPLLPPQIQQKIASLIEQSHEARRNARELLEHAIKQVEDTIENTALTPLE